jgi:FkbM family methyltransferase
MLPVKVKHNIKTIVQRVTGLSISSQRNDFAFSRKTWINRLKPDLVIDCGANSGQWGSALKSEFPDIRLISFEPISAAFETLKLKTHADDSWEAYQFALSSHSGSSKIKIASNEGMSSSLSNPSLHTNVHPEISFMDGEEVLIKTLDDFDFPAKRIFLKIDVQGHESQVLAGAVEFMKSVVLIEIESSFTPLYESEVPHHELISHLFGLGFTPFNFGNIHQDSNGRIWQLDTLLVRSDFI